MKAEFKMMQHRSPTELEEDNWNNILAYQHFTMLFPLKLKLRPKCDNVSLHNPAFTLEYTEPPLYVSAGTAKWRIQNSYSNVSKDLKSLQYTKMILFYFTEICNWIHFKGFNYSLIVNVNHQCTENNTFILWDFCQIVYILHNIKCPVNQYI